MLFCKIASSFAQMRLASSRLDMTRQLASLLGEATPHEASMVAYLSLGELAAPYKGMVFSIAERLAQPVVSELLGWSLERCVLEMGEIGDLGDLLERHGRWKVTRACSLQEIYASLQSLSHISGVGAQDVRSARLKELLLSVAPGEAGLIIRIVVGKLRLGFSDMTLIDALSWLLVGSKKARPVVERAYNLCADIGLIASMARSQGLIGLEGISLHLGIPLRPAAAERLGSPQEIIEKIGPCVVQPKLDGFRLQLHLERTDEGMRVWWFSRNVKAIYGLFPELDKEVTEWKVANLIVEGEALAYDEETGAYLPFQQTAKRKRKYNVASIADQYPLHLVLFDLLYLNNTSYIEQPHSVRYHALKTLMHGIASTDDTAVVVIDEKKVHTAKEVENYFVACIEEGLEGIIAKRDDALYQAGRRNANWIKLKRVEVGHLKDTIDAVVLGYYKGKGKRAAFGIGAFLIGVYDKEFDRFVTIAKIGTGLSDEEWVSLRQACDQQRSEEQPKNIFCSTILVPTRWVYPQIVVEVEADEITRSPVHTAGRIAEEAYGFALRFPRMIRIRSDKSIIDATTVAEIRSLYYHQR